MKIPFSKVYVLSIPSFKSRYEFILKQLKDLEIPFNFNWGIDLGNINNDSLGYRIHYPQLFEYEQLCTGKDFSCSLNHYSAILKAYEFGYNSILIIEDDVCFIKNKKRIELFFNNIPQDADFVTFDPRFSRQNDINQFNLDISNNKELYIKDNGQYNFMFGGMMYAIMNRETMKLYLENQRKRFYMCDHVQGLFMNVKVNKYISSKCICTDQLNIQNNFITDNILNSHSIGYVCQYPNLDINKFYIPEEFSKNSERLNR